MRSPQTVLETLRKHAQKAHYQYERLYRNLYNPQLYLLAYQNLYANKGSTTAGADGATLSGMSLKRIESLIKKLRDRSYQPHPARRQYIPKKSGNGLRPLGIPAADDKLVQEAVRMILESIYEPTFQSTSHGFRPGKSCHTALSQIQKTFTGVSWFVEGDIKGCFDNIDHHILVNILKRRIKDEAFIDLIWKLLRAGYLEDWMKHQTYSGTPQGSGVSPLLANIYMNELDLFMEKLRAQFGKGDKRRFSNDYSAQFLYKAWKRFRKYGAALTAATQNVEECLRSETARLMFANSEFLVLLNQAATDRAELAKLLNISENQMGYVTNAEAGHGLLRVGGAIVPFANEFPRTGALYQLWNTTPTDK